MKRQSFLTAVVCILATTGCDFSALGSKPASGQVIIETTSVEAEETIQRQKLAVAFEQYGASALLSPVKIYGDETVWLTDDMVNLTERQGVVIATQGLGSDIVSIDAELPSAWDDLPTPRVTTVIHRYFSDSTGLRIRGYVCEISAPATVSHPRNGVIEQGVETRVACRNADTTFENYYWRDRQGRMIQSRQWLGSQLGYANLRHPDPQHTSQADATGDQE
ncbi:YjbF family lipoprotein [Tropicimonas marinistellae]|uniref:YjbF family lipoprotein n=1 Tax=Tropicimonas marinistellae TaxID=1739787 RepID=UPI000832C753|nr:YjbF family lipoprotein [Tropicimonas marinistellae]